MNLDFKEMNRRLGRPNISIADVYESILKQRGIYEPMTKISFNTLYGRYKKLGGGKKFSYSSGIL